MKDPKTTILGILTLVVAIATGAKEYLATGTLPDLGVLVTSLTAGWGLIVARDASSK
jgi:hypothetical protein